MNSKLGGLPWHLNIPLANCMFLGYDVCHDTSDKSRSYGALVATIGINPNNPNKYEFFSCVDRHKNGEEISDELASRVVAALKKYHSIMGKYPDRILFYRDGVGEGQVNQVYQV